MIKQTPQKMMNQMGQQLKRINPQAYQEYQQARQSGQDPNAFLNNITNKFNNEQKQQWNNMMNQFK